MAFAVPVVAAEKEEAARRCVAAVRDRPADAAAREELRRLFTEEYPLRLPAEVISCLPVPHHACEDITAAAAPAQRAFYTTGLAFPDAAHRRDPEANQAFNRVLHGYVQEAKGGEWRLAFRVLYNQEQGGAELLAPRVMRLLLRVRAVHDAFLGDPRGMLERPVDVWLRADGDGGAEQSFNNLYLLGTSRKREPVELLRQMAHEFGHLALPGIGPLKDPEPWGNGFLGEMLYLRWLSRAPAGEEALVPQDALAAYVRQEVEPLARAFAAVGWGAFAGNETGLGGLRLLLGMVLHLEDQRGAPAVRKLIGMEHGTGVAAWAGAARLLAE